MLGDSIGMDQQKQPNEGVKALLKRYLQGNTTQEENERIANWYDKLPEASHVGLSAEERAGLEKSMLRKIHHTTTPIKPIRHWLRYAAAVLIVASLGGFAIKNYFFKPQPTVVQTGVGVSRQVRLPDSSIVVLNASSTLYIDADFGKEQRNVKLEGEAFFEIRANATRPFNVQHGHLTTTVLGTSFNIRAYPGEQQARIAVASGRVKVAVNGSENQPYLLNYQETLQYNNGTGSIARGKEDTSAIGQWQQKVLNFSNNTLPEMIAELRRQYPDSIRLYTTGTDTTHYSISFHQESIKNILTVLESLTGITYKKEDGHIIIYSKTYAH